MLEKLKQQFTRLNKKEQKTVKFGLGFAFIIIAYVFGFEPALNQYNTVRADLARAKNNLNSIEKIANAGTGQQRVVLSKVPLFEMPADEQTQRALFRSKINEQLTKAGIAVQTLQYVSKPRREMGLTIFKLQFRGKCETEKLLNFLAMLDENPYLVAVEQMHIRIDPKNRRLADIVLEVSTAVGNKG